MPGIPDRWLVYSPLGKIVGDTKFIPFKVPLKLSLCKNLSEMERFTPSDLLNMAKLGLVIDLTNTRRYYNSEDLISSGVTYVKIFCQGHGKVPNLEIVDKFYDAVRHFVNEKKDGLIGVHCTHGLNRTGYLICRYMIEKLGYSADKAVKEFNEARGHPIERSEYINDLYKIEKTKYRNATRSKNYETDDKTRSQCNTHAMKPRYQSRFHHSNDVKSNSNGFCHQSYFQNSTHYHGPPRYYQKGKYNGYNYSKQYQYDSYREATRLPRRQYLCQSSYRNRNYEGKHNYSSCAHTSQLSRRETELD